MNKIKEHNTDAGRVYRDEIYDVDILNAIGSEQCGRCPYIIVSNDIGNRYSSVVEVVY